MLFTPLLPLFVCFNLHSLSDGLPRWLSGKDSTCQAGDLSSVPGSGRSSEKEMAAHSYILLSSILWTEACCSP